ncbi:hypothetical protein AKJ41_04845, partial [candidate division MSBL1 archaeon SCGC-AAA259O05]
SFLACFSVWMELEPTVLVLWLVGAGSVCRLSPRKTLPELLQPPRETLRFLEKKGFELALVTNADRKNLDARLEKADLYNFFPPTVSGEESRFYDVPQGFSSRSLLLAEEGRSTERGVSETGKVSEPDRRNAKQTIYG